MQIAKRLTVTTQSQKPIYVMGIIFIIFFKHDSCDLKNVLNDIIDLYSYIEKKD